MRPSGFSFIGNAPFHSFRHGKLKRVTSPRSSPRLITVARDASATSKSPPEFDRNYYDKLKDMYKDDPDVHIFSRDDYELDPKEAPWLYDYRGRDLNVIRENVRKRVEEYEKNKKEQSNKTKSGNEENKEDEDDDDGIPIHALQWTDLHTGEELRTLRERALTQDISNGRLWSCPMTEEELEFSEETEEGIHFRPDREDAPVVMPTTDGVADWGDSPSLEAMGISEIEEDAISELEDAYRKMTSYGFLNTNPNGSERVPHTWGESIPIPDADEYKRWQREAEIRGGNAVFDEAHDFAPYADVFGDQQQQPDAHANGAAGIPPQHDALVEAYAGKWSGTATVIEMLTPPVSTPAPKTDKKKAAFDNFNPAVRLIAPVESNCIAKPDGTLNVQTRLSIDTKDVCVDVPFSSSTFFNSLTKNRAVSDDGSYVFVGTENGGQCLEFSLPVSTLVNLVSSVGHVSSETRPVIEIGLLRKLEKGDECKTRWHRIFLFTHGRAVDIYPFDETDPNIKKTPMDKFTHVLVLTETKITSNTTDRDITQSAEPVSLDLPSVSVRDLLGKWQGTAKLLQPEYFSEGMRHVQTENYANSVTLGSLTEADVTRVEDELEFRPGEESKRQQRQDAKRKVSARVKAARKHDETRLAKCGVVISDTIGDVSPCETHGWTLVTPREQASDAERISHMTSPRIGRFVDDYAGLALVDDALWVSFPYARAFPAMWNVITVTEISAPTRRRIVAGRSIQGILVGGLFTTERAVVDDEKGSFDQGE